MSIFKDIISYYRLGFSRMLMLSVPSCRKELNYFLLAYMALWMLVLFVLIIVDSMLTVIIENGAIKIAVISSIFCLLFHILHIIPLFTLMKRRLIDVVPSKANLIFLSILLMYLIQISAPIIFITNIENIISNPEITIVYIPYILFSILCGWAMFGTLIFLMCKKGNLTTAPLDNPIN